MLEDLTPVLVGVVNTLKLQDSAALSVLFSQFDFRLMIKSAKLPVFNEIVPIETGATDLLVNTIVLVGLD